MRDDFVGYIAEKLRESLKELVGVTFSPPRVIQVGDVTMTNTIVQFHADNARDRSDPYQGVIALDLTFYAEGALMLVLALDREKDRAYAMDLESGKTGWLSKEALTYYE